MKCIWRCEKCGWISKEKTELPPEKCEICEAGIQNFEPVDYYPPRYE